MNHYLLEIGLEEMPAQMILPAIQQLADKIKDTCQQNQLSFETLQTFSTPRRLAVLISGLPDKQADQSLELKGPPAHIAKDEAGHWSKAAQGFAKKNNIPHDELFIQEFQGREFVFARKEVLGKSTQDVFQDHAASWIGKLSFPKNMRWGAYKTRYIRPIRWIASVWNQQLLPISLEMVEASTYTYGHRFLNPGPFLISHAQDYLSLLTSQNVMANYQARQTTIIEQVRDLEAKHGFQVVLEKDLLEEVTNLVEWPTAIMGSFEPEFLEVPTPVLVTSMAKNQRYFPVYGHNQKLLPYFITVRNGNAHASKTVAKGNEKVLRARLSDARFFYQEDQKRDISYFLEKAKHVVFFKDRGTQAQRIERITALTQFITEQLALEKTEQQTALRIAALCQFDLQTQMVYEFPELQGVMGEDYAALKGEPAIVSRGIREHYHPRFHQDSIPQDQATIAVALADKMDMLVTAFSLNKIPTGSQDPYALRRMAQGILQIILEAKLPVSVEMLGIKATEILVTQQDLQLDQEKIRKNLTDFFALRQRFFLQEEKVRYDVIEALLKSHELLPVQQLDLAERLKEHLSAVRFKLAVEGIVRSMNIAQKQAQNIEETFSENQLEEIEEQTLWQSVQPLLQAELSLDHFLSTLFSLETPITHFFDKVMVMDEDPVKRQNRLFLCKTIAEWSLKYMDLREIVFPKDA